jgi:dTDP-4-amino-4,6-dideoxygalactose transaminase
MLKLFKPFISEESKVNVLRVLNTDFIAEGDEVKLFEQELEAKLGKKNILTLNSGTAALELAYELAGIEEGDEVITPILTCTATNLPLLHRKAKIVFADISTDLNIDIEDVKKKITDRTRAIVFVNFGGNSRGLAELVELCNARNIKLIEDAAQAIGSDYWGKADFTAVSLQAIKTITSGDGGLLICRDDKDYEKAKRLRWFGIDRDAKQRGENPDVTEAGYKYHMNNISAAIGRGNLAHFDELVAHVNKLGDIYRSYGLFSHVWLAGGLTNDYNGLKKLLNDLGIEVGQHHYRNDRYTVFSGKVKDCPVMDEIASKYFFIPLHYGVTEEQAHLIGKICQQYI